jgi:hypothetical protein
MSVDESPSIHSRRRVHRRIGIGVGAAVICLGATSVAADMPSDGHDMASMNAELAQVRRATARFHDVDAALAAGYELGWVNGSGDRIITGCVAHPTAGAMGYHYFNAELMADLAVDALQPEVLVYAPGPQGDLKLAAVEWVARGERSDPPGVFEPPSVLGMPMHILNPAVGFHLMHAWVWRPNPAGMFADWNPEINCP